MTKNRSTLLWKVLVVFIIATMLLVACAPQAAEEAPAAEEPAAAEEVDEEEAEVEEAEEPVEAEEAAEFSYEATSGEEVVFQGWQFATDVVQDNVKRYNEEMNGNVTYATIAGDYSAIMENKLLANAPLDMLYGHIYDAVRFYEGGWLTPVNEFDKYEAIKEDMYPHIADYWSYDGKLLGLSYFTSVLGVVAVNLQQLEAAGLTPDDYPATWDELYDQLYEIRDAGIDTPFMPSWYNQQWGIPWAFLFEVLNRGGMTADPETHAPMLTVDGPGGETLRDWKMIFNDGIVEEEVLSYQEADFLEAWESGRYVYSPTMAYNIKSFNNPENSTFAGDCSFIPYQGQPWGMIDAAVYIMTDQDDRSEEHTKDAERFVTWYGFEDQNGDSFVAERWLNDFNLFSAYKSVMESDTARTKIGEGLSDPSEVDALMEIYENASYPKGVFNVVWSAEFQSFLKETLQNFLLEDLPVDETIDALNNKIAELNATYGIE